MLQAKRWTDAWKVK